MKIQVKPGLEIGEGCRPYIICEVGSNWRDLSDALLSVTQAKLAGADAVKFQLFTYEDLYGTLPNGPNTRTYHADGSSSVVTPYALPPEWLPRLKEKADACGIDFMSTAFSPEGYDIVNPYVDVHKAASAELTHTRILQKLRQLGKPVILSTGASSEGDIRGALHFLGDTPTVLMYCVAAYPARVVDLSNIKRLKDAFGTLVGYSDHSVDVLQIPMAAYAWEACVIEKHVNFVGIESPDAPHSLSPDEFKLMVHSLRGGMERKLGPTPEEKPMILRHNRRLIAIRDIEVGETLQEGVNFGIYRSLKDDTKAAHPFLIDELNGRTVKVSIKAGDGIPPHP